VNLPTLNRQIQATPDCACRQVLAPWPGAPDLNRQHQTSTL
jgi:hypothetical protein